MTKNKPHRITGVWQLSDIAKIKKNGLKVFSCFHCGGGSSMGYKLAGYNVLGGVEIDEKMMALYKANHSPVHSYKMRIQDFNKLGVNDIPDELKNIDILDGSPPCSSFSLSGKREKTWGKERFFHEGQSKQHLDDLFFDFIQTANQLKPKVVIAENVKGLIQGRARGYVKQIFNKYKEAGYDTQLFLFNAASMGVPQYRERVFFISRRKDLKLNKLSFNFNENQISLGQAFKNIDNLGSIKNIKFGIVRKLWGKAAPGEILSKVHPKGHFFNLVKSTSVKPSNTLTASSPPFHWYEPRYLTTKELIQIQSFPTDYNFLKSKPSYVIGMSVPPFMIQRIGLEIAKQIWGINYNENDNGQFFPTKKGLKQDAA
ncbi:MAG: DNA (cytosine-5-)-methyltransferase [Planctomycetota bacterium]|nr:MAG: DNA (cytosine-5-)-methyltransferase [Planctomycetota bacterium]